jgi:hypothetical protein
MWTQKICHSNIKIKNKRKNYQMENLLMKCIETFLIYIYILFKKNLNDMIVVNVFLKSLFHIKNFNLLHGFVDQSHV